MNDSLSSPSTQAEGAETSTRRDGRRWSRLASLLSVNRIGGVYVWIVIIVVFSIAVPVTFPTMETVKQVLNSSAVTGLAALAVTIPLSARVFDLSFASIMSLSGVIAAKLVVGSHASVEIAVAVGILAGLGVGVVNAMIVVVMKIDSFIATLATGLLVQSLITMLTGDVPINAASLAGGFSTIGQTDVGGITLGVFYFLVAAIAIWFLLEQTSTGRRLSATGFNADAARLVGVRVDRIRFGSLVASGVLSGVAGVVLASTISSGVPDAGQPYLLTAFAAAFLGATQIARGRFNAFGTIIAVLLLGTGTTGLSLAAAPDWTSTMFVGVVLIGALAVTGLQRRSVVRATKAVKAVDPEPGAPADDQVSPALSN